jgi:hypothetical protein
MKTAAQIASHPKARLHRELVANLRAFGSIEGAEPRGFGSHSIRVFGDGSSPTVSVCPNGK